MTSDEIKQRISYLIEHGGIWDDPLDDMRRQVTKTRTITCAAVVLVLVDILVGVFN